MIYPISSSGGLSAATQAEQETASSTSVAVTPGRQQYHPSAAKGWVNFNGTGTPAVVTSFGVSSITDNGTSDWTVNWSTAFSTARYAWAASSTISNYNQTPYITSIANVTLATQQTTTSLRVCNSYANISLSGQDADQVCVIAFGDQ